MTIREYAGDGGECVYCGFDFDQHNDGECPQ